MTSSTPSVSPLRQRMLDDMRMRKLSVMLQLMLLWRKGRPNVIVPYPTFYHWIDIGFRIQLLRKWPFQFWLNSWLQTTSFGN